MKYTVDTKCSVEGCKNNPEYEVFLYDLYILPGEEREFLEQDFTCPFLCKEHMEINEQQGQGDRKPRGYVRYPFSNSHGAQGYTKYKPLSELFPIIYQHRKQAFSSQIILLYNEVNDELIRHLKANPLLMRDIDPRRFEELVARIFEKKGYDVSLTQATRDGGKDIYAIKRDGVLNSLYLIECKRYAEQNKVGVETVRALYGVLEQEKATMGIIATTSSFTQGAMDFAAPLEFRLSLAGFDSLDQWLKAL